MSFSGDNVVLKHSVLGEMSIQVSGICYIRRTPAGITWLERLETPAIEQAGPVSQPPLPRVIRSMHNGEVTRFLRAIRMMPRTVARYRLPKDGTEGKYIFRAELVPVAGCRGETDVRISAAGKQLWKQSVDGKSDPAQVEIELPAGSELTIEVDFGKRLAFPCGVDWRDAHLLSATEAVASP